MGGPWVQWGKAAHVYRIDPDSSGNGSRALKVFKPEYVDASQVGLVPSMTPHAAIKGLRVCERFDCLIKIPECFGKRMRCRADCV